jgi:ABC-type glycerol-3-phosphate transport system permease component
MSAMIKKRIWMDIAMIPLCFVVAYPLIFMVLGSFKSRAEFATNPYGIVKAPTVQNFITAFEDAPFLNLLWNNIFQK